MDIDDLSSDNHRPEDQDPEAAVEPQQQTARWNGAPDGPFSNTSPF